MYRVIFHDQGEPWFGLHEVNFDDAGEVTWWNRELVSFRCDGTDGRDVITQLLMAAAGDAGRWPALNASELP
jgi:hypothetical protein